MIWTFKKDRKRNAKQVFKAKRNEKKENRNNKGNQLS